MVIEAIKIFDLLNFGVFGFLIDIINKNILFHLTALVVHLT